MNLPGAKLGFEMEMAVVHRDSGESHVVSGYFERLARLKAARGEAVTLNHIGSHVVGLCGPAGESGLDNGYNLLETSFSPVIGGSGGLDRLATRVRQELLDVQETLAQENATVLNVSEHPFCRLDQDWYARIRVPRPIYDELVEYRGWQHHIGIDAKAQNSPCTSVAIQDAVRALNVVLGLAPAVIALFANSPLEGGRVTGLKENRLTIWDRMFQHSRFAGDHFLQRLPEQPFADLGGYFRWMFGANTVSRALPSTSKVAQMKRSLAKVQVEMEHIKASLRAKVEHPFRVIKRQFGYSKVRYRGLAKNMTQIMTLFALSNLWMARGHLMAQVRP